MLPTVRLRASVPVGWKVPSGEKGAGGWTEAVEKERKVDVEGRGSVRTEKVSSADDEASDALSSAC